MKLTRLSGRAMAIAGCAILSWPIMTSSQTPLPPVAKVQPHVVTSPHGDRQDEYHWLRDDDAKAKRPEIMAYLRAENAYTDAMLAHTEPLQRALVREMRARIKEDDSSVPVFDNGYWYSTRFDVGAEYPVHLRQRGSVDGPDAAAPLEGILDEPTLAKGKPFYALGGWAVSPDNQWLAWTEDTVGRRINTLRIKNLVTGAVLPAEIPGVLEDVVWAADSATLFYIRQDPQTLQSGPVYRHVLGTDPRQDVLVHDEADKTLFTSVGRTASREYIAIWMTGFTTTELRVVPAQAPHEAPRVALPRRENVRSYADHLAGRWIIRTNDRAKNFRLMQASDATLADPARWTELVPHRDDTTLEDFALFDRALVVQERAEANARLSVLPWNGQGGFTVQADETAFVMRLGPNLDPALPRARYGYDSMVTPHTVYDVDLATGARSLRKTQPVLGYERSLYDSARLWAPCRDQCGDGKRIPVSIMWRKDAFKRDGAAPLVLFGYGAYGYSYDPYLNTDALSLLDRGVAIAIAHVRGGSELGEGWYDDGKLEHKQNTFNDFVDVTRYLKAERWAGKVFASGGSAGGLLMGAVANQAGMEYAGISLWVPFVDVVTTMLDATIPLTTNEWTQWGDPRDKAAYERMLAYSPYDNIERKSYPPMLVHSGLWDSQVQYFEPAKYVARLRARKTDANPLLMHMDLESGHGGKSGRFERLRETAREFAFFLDLAGGQR
ncbi:MAG: S9 family peptidase [Burkholderiales bacterium]|nr:S9 family peptidase [Burkholderiales bacterium]